MYILCPFEKQHFIAPLGASGHGSEYQQAHILLQSNYLALTPGLVPMCPGADVISAV